MKKPEIEVTKQTVESTKRMMNYVEVLYKTRKAKEEARA